MSDEQRPRERGYRALLTATVTSRIQRELHAVGLHACVLGESPS